ncbi:drug:H+ antiporter-2 (14 Spanner) (DHA2) family drug resistance MFS transporter [Corynebacterium pyruviciproducens ATCC BAA-1742]|uniref:Drug:H+ antiporter-2 (14 Spanner) (DHA2) family drug resistance MFS transporter n=2 Tax=Corynebacterium pyruviciproducens TaxID=598660 RepID=S2Z075_9CORY|nr:MFS transporter [Corynebacterium pyruviciproducens]EPD69896.1 drug:H+ antiporter-2 (14 Spanner) (DHA2) family drug resistance MFS transporter [Corynebacterium pyruviciproducens ATCC BAA-1742]MDK6566209.1 MFS transporter [Corynebacterium pyruviciproducens]WOT03081.1 MFS transporter [Corynebacterium pyruviciproducens]
MSQSQRVAYSVTGSAYGWPLIVLCALQLMVVLDGTVVNLALARIQQDLGLTDELRSWVVTAYALAYGGLLLLGGRIGDVFGRKKVFLLGVGLFTLASLACGVTTSAELLLAARVVQGLGAAIASPTAMALLVVTFAPGKARNQAFSVFAMMTGLGSVLGLVIGGALTQASWRWIFLINVPIGVLILLLGTRHLRHVGETAKMSLDVRGAVLATGASTLLVFGLTAGGSGASPLIVAALILGVIVLVAFFLSQRNATHPVLPLSMFANRSRAAVFVCLLLVGALMMAMTVQVALFVQEVLQYTPLQAGLAFIPFAFALGAGSALAGKVAETVAPRYIAAVGGAILIGGFVYGSTLDTSASYWPDLLIPILIIGAGIGIVLIPLTLSVVAGVTPDEVGPLTATSLVCQTLGGPLGLAGVTAFSERVARSALGDPGFESLDRSLLNNVERDALGAGYTDSLLICATLAALVVIICLTLVRFTPEDIREGKVAEELANQG